MKATIKTFESGAGDCEFFILRDEQTYIVFTSND